MVLDRCNIFEDKTLESITAENKIIKYGRIKLEKKNERSLNLNNKRLFKRNVKPQMVKKVMIKNMKTI